MSSSCNVRVVVRFRIVNEREKNEKCPGETVFTFPDEQTVKVVKKNGKTDIFTLDRVFHGDCKQEDVYDMVAKETISDILQGYNGTIFAYGQVRLRPMSLSSYPCSDRCREILQVITQVEFHL